MISHVIVFLEENQVLDLQRLLDSPIVHSFAFIKHEHQGDSHYHFLVKTKFPCSKFRVSEIFSLYSFRLDVIASPIGWDDYLTSGIYPRSSIVNYGFDFDGR